MNRITLPFVLVWAVCCLPFFALAQNHIWAHQYGLSQHSDAFAVTSDRNGNLYLLGEYNGPRIVFDTDSLLNYAPYGVNFQTFLVKMDDTGKTIWARNIGMKSALDALYVTTDAHDNVFVSGTYFDTTAIIGADTLRNADTSGQTPDLFISKLDSSGNILWAKSANGVDFKWIYDMKTDPSGNTYVCGRFISPTLRVDSFLLVNAVANDTMGDMFVYKLDPQGKCIWARRAGGPSAEALFSIAFDPTGNLVMTGEISSPAVAFGNDTIINPYPGMPLLIKVDTAGNYIWVRQAGDQNISWEYRVACTRSGNIYATGVFSYGIMSVGSDTLQNNEVTFDDFFVAKYDSAGTPIWARSGGGIGEEVVTGLVVDTSEQVFVCGYFDSPMLQTDLFTRYNQGEINMFMVRYDSAGANTGSYVNGGTLKDETYCMTLDRNNDLVVAGSITSPAVAIGQDSLGAGGKRVAFVSSVLHDTVLSVPRIPVSYTPNLVVYPNPGNGIFHICADRPLNESTTVLTDVFGRKVPFTIKNAEGATAGKWIYNLDTNCSPGLYYLKSVNGDKILTRPIIVQR